MMVRLTRDAALFSPTVIGLPRSPEPSHESEGRSPSIRSTSWLPSLFKGRPFYKFIEEGEVEPSIYYTDPVTGLACRTRPDLLHPEFTFDLKSTRHASTSAFQRDAVELHYDLQAFMYSLARCTFEGSTKAKPFVFVKVTSDEPFSTHFMPCVDDFIRNGYEKYAAALSAIKACNLTNHWPAPQGEVAMDLLPWQVFKNNSASWSGAPATA